MRSGSLRDEAGAPLSVDAIQVPADERWVLVQANQTKRWRHSVLADHWILHRRSGRLERLSPEGQEIHVDLSPDGTRVGWVQGGNLWMRPLDGDAVRLTDDGSDTVFNGDPDWVYEEELGILRAWWWSPDSRRIAYLHTDASVIRTQPLVRVGEESYPTLEQLPYPKAGFENSRVTLRVLDLDSGESRDLRGVGSDDGYLARVQWIPGTDALVYQWIDRAQETLELVRVDADGSQRTLVRETSPGWIDVQDDPWFLPDGAGFLWTSERDGFRHLYRYDLDGNLVAQLTSGPWEIREVVWTGSDHAILLTTRGSHLDTLVDRVDLEDGTLERLGEPRGWHAVDVAPDGEHYLETRSAWDQRAELRLRTAAGQVRRALVEDDMADLLAAPPREVRIVRFHTADDTELWARLTLPPGFDERQRHPVLVFGYGGPGSQRVRNRWDTSRRDLFHAVMAQEGYVVFTVDGRGTGGRGTAFKHAVDRRLGELEVIDQIAGIDWLTRQPFVDAERIALWGWSYGGTLTALTARRAGEKLRAGIVGAPVADWRFYDTIYTERHMGTPQDNPEGYRRGSLLHDVDGLSARLLLLHGTADDNVHLQNTVRFAGALQEAGVAFDMMLYPDQNHGMRHKPSKLHQYRTMREFLLRELGPGPTSPRPEGR